MSLLLTILSVLAGWTFLGVLFIGLFLIRKVLESVRLYLEKIAMGVRAIEQQTAPMRERAEAVQGALDQTAAGFAAVTEQFTEMDRLLDATPPALRTR